MWARSTSLGACNKCIHTCCFLHQRKKKENHAVSLKYGSLQFVALCFFTEIGMEIIDLSVSGLSVSDVEWEIKLWN